MELQFREVFSENDIKIVAQLAKNIWNEHYISIISKEQIDYMLAKFQSEDEISMQITIENYDYFLIIASNIPVGYIAVKQKESSLFLSKFYILKEFRRCGIGSKSVDFIIKLAKNQNSNSISLTVNKYNTNSINAYKKYGFTIQNSIITDVGSGFVMDDYVMELNF